MRQVHIYKVTPIVIWPRYLKIGKKEYAKNIKSWAGPSKTQLAPLTVQRGRNVLTKLSNLRSVLIIGNISIPYCDNNINDIMYNIISKILINLIWFLNFGLMFNVCSLWIFNLFNIFLGHLVLFNLVLKLHEYIQCWIKY